MASEDSVSQWILGVQHGDSLAAQRLWERYYGRLVRLADRNLNGSPRRMADEEDVVVSAFAAFCQAAEKGRFPELTEREGLWRLLVKLTAKKAASQLRRQFRKKRGGGLVRGESVFWGPDQQPSTAGLDGVIGDSPTPEFAAAVAEECSRLFDLLDEDLRSIAVAKMEGYTNLEIADRLKCSLSTVERSLRMIRKAWERE